MTDHQKYNKIIKKLNDREFIAKALFDQHGDEVKIDKSERVYLKSEIDEVLHLFKTDFEEFINELTLLKKQKENLELELYKIQKTLKRVQYSLSHEKKK